MNYWILGGAVIWIICGIISYVLYFGYFQREFKRTADEMYYSDKRMSFLFSLMGPIALLSILLCGLYKHGFKFK